MIKNRKGQIEFAVIVVMTTVMLIIGITGVLARCLSEYAYATRLDKVLRLSLIDTENMNVETRYVEKDNQNLMLQLEPDSNIEQAIRNVLELNFIGNGLTAYNIDSVEVDYAFIESEHKLDFSVPAVYVKIVDQNCSPGREVINAYRVLAPYDLLDNYEEIVNEEN